MQPPYPPNQQPPYGYMPPKPTPRPQPVLVWICIGVFALLTIYAVWNTVVALTNPKTPAKAYQVTWFDASDEYDSRSSKIFEAQGVLNIVYGCQYDALDGRDMLIEIVRLDSGAKGDGIVWKRDVECPVDGADILSVESGKYAVNVYSSGTGWNMTVWQSL